MIENIKGLVLDKSGKLNIPTDKKRVKIDVGLSYCAPNSALWLSRESDLFVIGIEPDVNALNSIKQNRAVWDKKLGIRIDTTLDNYMLLECAIDDTPEIKMQKFYAMKLMGTSSLLKPTGKLLGKASIIGEYDVLVVSLARILDLLPWDRFDHIDLVKTDCQGKDRDVVASMYGYLKRVVYLNCELTAASNYEDEIPQSAFLSFLSENGFVSAGSKRGEGVFVNESLKDMASKHNISKRCINL